MKGDNIAQRLLSFGATVRRVASQLPKTPAARQVAKQLIRAATASGANYEEARGAESRPDVVHKIKIAGKEMREAHYWLRLIQQARLSPACDDLVPLIQEAHELVAILTTSAQTATSPATPSRTGNWVTKNQEP